MDLPCGWTLAKTDGNSLRLVYLEESEIDCTQDPKITKSVTILSDFTWELRILNQLIMTSIVLDWNVQKICSKSRQKGNF